ncbi:MAG: hypothetical protein HQ558_00005, partial [Candidatus Omnitrophica bacterium]|nr:hypothetical protein [Candidatus Omnitrophota bacterium]
MERHRSTYSRTFKTISWIVIVTFMWQQLAYAGAADIERRQRERTSEKQGFSAIEFIKALKQEQQHVQQKAVIEHERMKSLNQATYDMKSHLFATMYSSYQQVSALLKQIEKARDLIHRASKTYVLFPEDENGKQKKIEFFRGNVVAIYDERVEDAGRVYYRDTYDMKYNDRALLVEYTSRTRDEYGGISEVHWYDAEYTADSLWYADEDTNADKKLITYKTSERFYSIATGTWQEIGEFTHKRSNINYDSNNNPESYTELVYDEDGNVAYRIEASECIYDMQTGELISYFRKVYDTDNNQTEEGYVYSELGIDAYKDAYSTVMTDSQIDVSGRMASFVEESRDQDGNLVYTVTRTDITYDEDGNVTGFHEVKTRADGDTVYDADFTVTLTETLEDGKIKTEASSSMTDGRIWKVSEIRNSQMELTDYQSEWVSESGTIYRTYTIYDDDGDILRNIYTVIAENGQLTETEINYIYQGQGADKKLLQTVSERSSYRTNGDVSRREITRRYDAQERITEYAIIYTNPDTTSWVDTHTYTYAQGEGQAEVTFRTRHREYYDNTQDPSELTSQDWSFSRTTKDADGKIIATEQTRVDKDGRVEKTLTSREYLEGSYQMRSSVSMINIYEEGQDVIEYIIRNQDIANYTYTDPDSKTRLNITKNQYNEDGRAT